MDEEQVLRLIDEEARQAWRDLGRFQEPVRDYIRRINKIRWLARAGQPEPWDDQAVRASNLDEARQLSQEFSPVTHALWEALEALGRAAGRFELMEAAETYYVAALREAEGTNESLADRIGGYINADTVGALREVILEDLVSINFYRDQIKWYEKGHWRCALSGEGRPVVY